MNSARQWFYAPTVVGIYLILVVLFVTPSQSAPLTENLLNGWEFDHQTADENLLEGSEGKESNYAGMNKFWGDDVIGQFFEGVTNAIINSGTAALDNAPWAWSTYHNTKLGYSIQYPSGWRTISGNVFQDGVKTETVDFRASVPPGENGMSQAQITVYVDPNTTQLSLDTLVEGRMWDLSHQNFKVDSPVSPVIVDIGNLSSRLLLWHGEGRGGPKGVALVSVVVAELDTILKGHCVLVVCTAAPSVYKEYFKRFNHVMNSLTQNE
jgi:hypothetical protein